MSCAHWVWDPILDQALEEAQRSPLGVDGKLAVSAGLSQSARVSNTPPSALRSPKTQLLGISLGISRSFFILPRSLLPPPLAVFLHRGAGRKERPDPLGTGRRTLHTELLPLDLSGRVTPCGCQLSPCPSMLRPNFPLPEGPMPPFNQIWRKFACGTCFLYMNICPARCVF